jgi:hypothetical protein
MRYVKVGGFHELDDQPVVLYSEVNDDGYEVRKVEEYADGHRDLANKGGETGSTFLSDVPLPGLAVINAQDEFVGEEITEDEFEEVWAAAWNWFDEP